MLGLKFISRAIKKFNSAMRLKTEYKYVKRDLGYAELEIQELEKTLSDTVRDMYAVRDELQDKIIELNANAKVMIASMLTTYGDIVILNSVIDSHHDNNDFELKFVQDDDKLIITFVKPEVKDGSDALSRCKSTNFVNTNA